MLLLLVRGSFCTHLEVKYSLLRDSFRVCRAVSLSSIFNTNYALKALHSCPRGQGFRIQFAHGVQQEDPVRAAAPVHGPQFFIGQLAARVMLAQSLTVT